MPIGGYDRPSGPVINRELASELRDVNERLIISSLREREASETAEHERAQWTAVLGALHDGVIIAKSDGRIVMVNAGARSIIGMAPSVDVNRMSTPILDVRGLDMTPIAPSEHPLACAMRGVVLDDVAMLVVRADGVVRHVVTSCTSVEEEGRVALAIVVVRDVTERRELEERLTQTERLAAIGALAAGVAHEINNPLCYVVSNLELAIEDLATIETSSIQQRTEIEKMLRDAQLGAERVRKIVRALKTFSRSDVRARSILDVRPILDLAVDMAFNEICHRARVVKAYGPVPMVEGDDGQLGQVFTNLLINAAHAFEETLEKNEIRITTSTDAVGRLFVEIRDNGRGIPAEILPRIFDPFFTTNAVGDGTGLGLSISRNIVLALGGEVGVQSREGGGTAVRVVLPPADRPNTTASVPPPSGSASFHRGAVLVVDDEPVIGVTLSRILKEHEVTVVTNVHDALELIASGRRFDVILSDLMMPEKSGIDLYHALQRISPEHTNKVVFLTGGAFTPDSVAFLHDSRNKCVEKPFTGAAIRSVVQTFIKPVE
jgi:signal transduction histidine kinase/CheY-like chemotaxis protein